jgi:hypothetical protein
VSSAEELREALSGRGGAGRRTSVVVIEDDIFDFYTGNDYIPYSTDVPKGNVDALVVYDSEEDRFEGSRGQVDRTWFRSYLVDPLVIDGVGDSRNPVVIQGVQRADGTNPRINASVIVRGNSNIVIQDLDIVPSIAVCTYWANLTENEPIIGSRTGVNVATPDGTIRIFSRETYEYETPYRCVGARRYAGMVVYGAGTVLEMWDSSIDMSRAADLRKANPSIYAGQVDPDYITQSPWLSAQSADHGAFGGAGSGAAVPHYGLYIVNANDIYLDGTSVINTSGRHGVYAPASVTDRVGIYGGSFSGAVNAIVFAYPVHPSTTINFGNISNSVMPVQNVSFGAIRITMSDLMSGAYFSSATIGSVNAGHRITQEILDDWATMSENDAVAAARIRITSAAAVVLRQIVHAGHRNPANEEAGRRINLTTSAAFYLPQAESIARGNVRNALYVNNSTSAMSQQITGNVRVDYPLNYSYSFGYDAWFTINEVMVPNADFLYRENGALNYREFERLSASADAAHGNFIAAVLNGTTIVHSGMAGPFAMPNIPATGGSLPVNGGQVNILSGGGSWGTEGRTLANANALLNWLLDR